MPRASFSIVRQPNPGMVTARIERGSWLRHQERVDVLAAKLLGARRIGIVEVTRMDDRRRDGLPMKRPNRHWSKRLRRIALNPDWRAGYLAGRAGKAPAVPPEIKDGDAWRDGYATGLRRGRRR